MQAPRTDPLAKRPAKQTKDSPQTRRDFSIAHPPPFTIEDVIEFYLIQQGCLQRTPRGRIAGLTADCQLGIAPPDTDGGLFDPYV